MAGGFIGDMLGQVGNAIEAGSDLIGVDHIGHALDSGFEQLGEGFSDAGHFLENRVWGYGIRRPISTALQLDETEMLNPGNWRRAWNNTRGTTIGQHTYDQTAGELSRRYGGEDGWDWVGEAGDPGFNLQNEEQRKAAFNSGIAKLSSGTIDAATRWYLDPLVFAGKGAALTRQKAVVKPIPLAGATRSEEEVTGIYDAMMSSKRIDRVVDRIASMSQTERAYVLARDFRDNAALAQVLTKAPDADAIRAILRAAIDGTFIQHSKLDEAYRLGRIEIETIRDVRIKGIENSLRPLRARLADNTTSPFYAKSAQAKADALEVRLKAEQANLVAAEQKLDLDRLLRDQVQGSLSALPRVKTTQRAGDALRNTRVPRVTTSGENLLNLQRPTWYTWQPSRYSPALRIIRGATSTRVGMVSHDVSGAATSAARGMVDRAGHGLGRGMPLAVRSRLVAAVNDAEAAGDPGQVAAALKEVEKEVLRHNGGLLGINADKVDLFVEQTHERTTRLTTQTISGTGEQVYSGVTVNGRRLDKMDDGTIVQLFNSQTPNTTPLTDIDEFTKLMRRHARDLDAADATTLRAALAGEDGALSVMNARGVQALESFNRFWKPAQLLRLGWPIRVVTDENFRSMSVNGVLAHLAIAGESLGTSLKQGNLGARVQDLQLGNIRARKRARAKLAEREPRKAAGEVRATLVDKLTDLMEREAKIDTELAAARAALDAVEITNRGQRLYRVDAPKAKGKTTPRGVRYTTTTPEAADGLAVHERIANAPAGRVYTPRSGYDDPGIAALADFTTVEQFQALAALSNRELRAKMAQEFPKLGTSRYKTKDDLLSVYGAELARRRDYSALSRIDDAGGTTFVALRDDALRELAPGHAEAAVRLGEALERKGTLAEARAVLTGERNRLAEWTDDMNREYQRLQEAVVPLHKRQRGAAGRPRKFSGDVIYRLGDTEYTYEDAFGGELGPIFMDQSSAASSIRNLAGVNERYLNGLRVKVGQPVVIAPVPPADATVAAAKLHRASYDRSWARAVNDQIGKDALGRQILDGRTNEEIVAWMRNHPVGQEYRRRNSVRGSDPLRWAQEARQQVEAYLPGDQLKELARQGIATADDLRQAYRAGGVIDDAALPFIHGDSLDLDGGVQGQLWAKLVDKLYAKIGTAPTDVLSRHPFFTAVYRSEMERQFDALAMPDGVMIPNHLIERMQHRARHKALGEVKRTLYDTANQSDLAHTFRFVMPFYAAWQDALQTWGRLWMEDPSRLARLAMAWEAPAKMGTVYTNPDGEKFVALPSFLAGPMGAAPGMPKDYFKELIFQGDYWYMPGVGAPITVPAAEILRNRPDLENLMKPLLPYGAGSNALDQILPAGWKRGLQVWKKEDDDAYLKMFTLNAKVLETDRRLGENNYTPEQLFAEARRRTDDVMRLRMIYNFTMPFSPNIRHPYQLQQDLYNSMQEQYRADPNVFGGLSPDEHFLDTVGEEYFAFTAAATKSNVGGIAPTKEGYQGFNKFKDLVARSPELGSFIVGDTNGEFSGAVQQWMLTHRIGGGNSETLRDIRSPKEALEDAEINRGWDEWRKIDTAITAAMQERGLRSLSQNEALDLRVTRTYMIEKLKGKYQLWAREYDVMDRGKIDARVAEMEELIEDPRLRDRPGHGSLAQYLALRATVVNQLAARKSAGGSNNLQAQVNTDLRIAFEYYTGKLKMADTYFADIHSRWLSNDDLDTGGGRPAAPIEEPPVPEPPIDQPRPAPQPLQNPGGNP